MEDIKKSDCQIIVFANQKGGVGKTTCAVNIAASVGILGRKVLLVDMDPQGNATSGVGIGKNSEKSVYDLLTIEGLSSLPIDDTTSANSSADTATDTDTTSANSSADTATDTTADTWANSRVDTDTTTVDTENTPSYAVNDIYQQIIQKTAYENLSAIPSVISLAGAELELVNLENRESRLSKALLPLKKHYDYIFIDSPPSLGLLTLNALCAADGVIVPMQCEYFALEGLSQLTMTISQVRKLYNPTLRLEGVMITMFDGRLNLSLQVLEEIKKHFPGKIYKTPIPRNVRLSEAPSFGMPAFYYDKYSKGAAAYLELAKEVIERNNRYKKEN